MQKVLNTLAIMTCTALLGSTLQAHMTLFDMAKDAMYIAKGEFVSLQRTGVGDKLTLRCDAMIKGQLATGTLVTLEAFEPAPADEALGRSVIAAFHSSQGKHYFLNHPFSQRGAFYFETDDTATDGLERSERALRNFIAINQPHEAVIVTELRKRVERQDLSYQGQFSNELINAWKAELLNQVSWTGTWAARDAAKALVDHTLFKGKCTPEELGMVGELLAGSETGSIGRAYMLELIRTEQAAHPPLPVLISMVREETSAACVGKLSNLLVIVEDRNKVLAGMGAIITDAQSSVQMRCNALQILYAIRDVNGLEFVHGAIRAEMNRGALHSKPVLRRAFDALKSTPSESNIAVIQEFQASEICTASWEMTQYAWVAYAMVDTPATNQKLQQLFVSETNVRNKRFFNLLLPVNKVYREIWIIHPES